MARGAAERGQATVEFALVLPLLIVGAALLVHLGLSVSLQLQLENAAREGARAAAVEPENATAVAGSAIAVAGGANFDRRVTVDAEFVEVRVERSLAVIPLLGVAERNLTAQVTMRREDLAR